jgi:hypothetical protein
MTNANGTALIGYTADVLTSTFRVEAMGLEPTNLLTASQALYQLSYAPGRPVNLASPWSLERCWMAHGQVAAGSWDRIAVQ